MRSFGQMHRGFQMKRIVGITHVIVCACTAFYFAIMNAASATTLSLPEGSSQATFSIQSTYPDTLTVGPVVTIHANDCPNSHCTNAYWDVNLTVDFFGPSNNLIASDIATVWEDCTPGNCTVPKTAFFSIPTGSTGFEIFNDVTVGGGWTYNAGSEFISAKDSQIAETPIPDSIFLFAAGLFVLSVLNWRGKKVPLAVQARAAAS
jgi:hypothetical protein